MDPLLAYNVQLWQRSTELIPKAFEGLTAEDVLRSPSPETSSMLWIFGHITSWRCSVAVMLGGEQTFPWPDLFKRGAHVAPSDQLPTKEEIAAVWRKATDELMKRIEEVSPQVLSSPAPRDFPVADKTVRGAINFLAYHEGYHLGQLALLRKWLGGSTLIG